MKMWSNLPDLGFEHCVPYQKMAGRIGWTEHRVRTHINMFCTKRAQGCSDNVPVRTAPASAQPGEDDKLCTTCKNTVWNLGMPHETRRLAIRANRGQLIKRLMPQIPEELRDIILEFQFTKLTNPYHVMQHGWDITLACVWRVEKFHTEEKQNIINDEKESRDWFEYMEGHGRQLTILSLR